MLKIISALKIFIRRIQLDSIKGIFSLFAILALGGTLLFYQVVSQYEDAKSKKISALANTKSRVYTLANQLAAASQNSLNHSLLYNISKKESERFETIYSLKSTSNKFDELFETIQSFDSSQTMTSGLRSLHKQLSEYDNRIASSINTDGKLLDLLFQKLSEPDSLEGDFLFEKNAIGMQVVNAEEFELLFDQIKHQTFVILDLSDHQVSLQIEILKSQQPIVHYVVFAMILAILIVVVGGLVRKNHNTSVSKLSDVLGHIAKGELPEVAVSGKGEFTQIINVSNELVHYLSDASQFAEKIGEGNFDYEFKKKSESDALGNSLIEMRNRLLQVNREDKIRNWVNEGHAKFGEILRHHTDDINKLGNEILINLIEYLHGSQGAMFVVKEDDQEHCLELLASYANKRKKFIEKRIEVGEGLAGQAFEEGKTIYLTDIKTDHYDIQTGLGASKPTSLLIVPLKDEDHIEGVIEIASLSKFEKHEIEFIEAIGENIASSLSSGKMNHTTKILLEETQEKAEKMRAQEEELRQNMEELSATQEQLERRNKEVEEINRQVSAEKLAQYHTSGFVILDLEGRVNYAADRFSTGVEMAPGQVLSFTDIFQGMDFKAFLANIDVENNEGAEMEILLTINGEEEIFIAKISDQHIFLVHK